MTEAELRALDAEVAEKVMGWWLFEASGETWAATTKVRLPSIQGVTDRLMFAGRQYGFFAKGWSPSTDIACAWQVVEAMRERHGLGAFFVEWHVEEADAWDVQMIILPVPGPRVDVGRCAKTLPEAICRAALAAMDPARRGEER